MEKFEDDIYNLMIKRVYDLSGIMKNGVKVYLNEELINIKSFLDYVQLY